MIEPVKLPAGAILGDDSRFALYKGVIYAYIGDNDWVVVKRANDEKNANRKKELRRLNNRLRDISRGAAISKQLETIVRQNNQILALNEELRLLRTRL